MEPGPSCSVRPLRAVEYAVNVHHTAYFAFNDSKIIGFVDEKILFGHARVNGFGLRDRRVAGSSPS